MRNLILASNSPRRKELFSLFGWRFSINPADIDEIQHPGEEPTAVVRRLAFQKAKIVSISHAALVIGADTIVVDGGEILGKPVGDSDARRMLMQLRGRIHQVYSGISIFDPVKGKIFTAVCRTDVPMRNYSDSEIEVYIATGDPMDKAGAYAIQHPGFHPVENLDGCYASVMGLPLCHLALGLRAFISGIPENIPERCQGFLGYACNTYRSILDIDWN